jgi:DNA-binding PadR family transcriptional regulator
MKMQSHGKHWLRHTAMVPKGFIRYHVLQSLGEKPMSGSEIMEEIEKRTDGRWKPSPGSIYPLLAWLQDNGYVKELPKDQSGLKRYELTSSGRTLLEEQKRIGTRFRKEARFFAPPFLGALWFRIPPEKTAQIRESIRRLMTAFFDLGNELEEKFSETAVEDARKALDETAERIEEITKRLKAEEYE